MTLRTRAARATIAVHLRVPAALLVLAVLLAVPTPAHAVEAQGIRVDPVEPAVLGDGSILQPGVPPGATATYTLRLRNQRDQDVEVIVYGADVDEDGVVASGRDNEGVGAWITATDPTVSLAAEATTVVDVTVARPAADEQGGTGAIVVQLSEASRTALDLDVVRRAAIRVQVAADGSGDGIVPTIEGTTAAGGLLPRTVTIDVRFTNPADAEQSADGAIVLDRPVVEDVVLDATPGTLAPGADVTSTVEVPLSWFGVVGEVRAEAATIGLTIRSAPTRVVVVPPWAAGVLLLATVAAVVRFRRSDGTPFELGRVPDRDATDDDEPAADEDAAPGDAAEEEVDEDAATDSPDEGDDGPDETTDV